MKDLLRIRRLQHRRRTAQLRDESVRKRLAGRAFLLAVLLFVKNGQTTLRLNIEVMKRAFSGGAVKPNQDRSKGTINFTLVACGAVLRFAICLGFYCKLQRETHGQLLISR